MPTYYNSNCTTLSAGCYLYNGPGLTNPVSNGYYSDGTNCFTVTGGAGYISSMDSCSATAVYINVIVPYTLGCYNYGDFCASSYDVYSNPINVDTNVQVQTYWNGDLGGQIYANIYITSGNNCGTGFAYTGGSINCAGEYFSYDSTATFPTTSGTQDYYINAVNTDNYSICPC